MPESALTANHSRSGRRVEVFDPEREPCDDPFVCQRASRSRLIVRADSVREHRVGSLTPGEFACTRQTSSENAGLRPEAAMAASAPQRALARCSLLARAEQQCLQSDADVLESFGRRHQGRIRRHLGQCRTDEKFNDDQRADGLRSEQASGAKAAELF